MELTNVIIRPYLTEKSYKAKTFEQKKYAFIVNKKANKTNIALAFESIFNIQPVKVTTMVRKAVLTRTGTLHKGYTKVFKIAYVTLPKGKDIAISQKDAKAQNKAATVKQEKTEKPASTNSTITIKEVKKDKEKPAINKEAKKDLSSIKEQKAEKKDKLEK